MTVVSEPLSTRLTNTFEFLTRGNYSQKLKERGQGQAVHRFIVMTLDDGQQFRVEKEHVVQVKKWDQEKTLKLHKRDDLQYSMIPIRPNPNNDGIRRGNDGPLLTNVFAQAQANQSKQLERGNFWHYNPEDNNCQHFTEDLVNAIERDMDTQLKMM